ncbi:hypothetical protein J6590_042391 [Homalodisca vitripennis]|nr:hypothetical protein J6590_042391 [Homalodisca vitripennis]
MSCVATHCRTAQNLPLINMRVGEPCCALYEDNKWYRAEILKVTQDKAFINFVDYGNHEEIEFENLRQITPELVTTVKAQALVCCLTGYETRLYNMATAYSLIPGSSPRLDFTQQRPQANSLSLVGLAV